MTFSGDAPARDVARRAIDRAVDRRIDPALLEFLYMPFMHSSTCRTRALHRAVSRRRQCREPEIRPEHADIIRRFGRFPHRNRMLGRLTTDEEQAFLDNGGFSG